jgi:hypothetical protein
MMNTLVWWRAFVGAGMQLVQSALEGLMLSRFKLGFSLGSKKAVAFWSVLGEFCLNTGFVYDI